MTGLLNYAYDLTIGINIYGGISNHVEFCKRLEKDKQYHKRNK